MIIQHIVTATCESKPVLRFWFSLYMLHYTAFKDALISIFKGTKHQLKAGGHSVMSGSDASRYFSLNNAKQQTK